jgi:quinol monooxygenase YgiN
MIIITATLTIRPEHLGEALAFSKRHVVASRLEAGCASHRFFVDPEAERTLVFLEEWRDPAAVEEHFAKPYAREFAAAMKQWCEGDPCLEIHEVAKTRSLTI